MRVNVLGFYGHGNIGDEAMLLGFARWLHTRGHEVAIQVDGKYGRDRYAQLGIAVKDLNDVRFVDSCDLIILGGGSLGPGYGWNILVRAINHEIPIVSLGMTFEADWLGKSFTVSRSLLSHFQAIIPRDPQSVDVLRELDIQSVLGADPVYLLDAPKRESDNAAIIFCRCPEDNTLRDVFSKFAIAAAENARSRGMAVNWGCCCQADWHFHCGHIGGDSWMFWDPEDCFRRITQHRLVISIGRLHPVIFANLCGRSCFAASMGIQRVEDHSGITGAKCYVGDDSSSWRERLLGWEVGQAIDCTPLRDRSEAMMTKAIHPYDCRVLPC